MKKKNLVISVLLLLSASLCGWFVTKYYLSLQNDKSTQNSTSKPEPIIDIQPDGRHSMMVKIFYPSENEIQLKEKKIYTNFLPVNVSEEVIKEYLKELNVPLSNTRLLGVYRDSNNIIYIDLSDDIRRYFSGDARFEHNLLESLLKTVLINVPAVEDVKLLVEGKEIESIGGHFYCLLTLKTSIHFSNN